MDVRFIDKYIFTHIYIGVGIRKLPINVLPNYPYE